MNNFNDFLPGNNFQNINGINNPMGNNAINPQIDTTAFRNVYGFIGK